MNEFAGMYIRTKRRELGISQNELSSMTGISKTQISKIENGQRFGTFINAVLISQVIGINVFNLYDDSKKMFKVYKYFYDMFSNDINNTKYYK